VKFLGNERGIGKAHAASARDKPPQDDDGAGDGGSSAALILLALVGARAAEATSSWLAR
jgi:hypothetical protein